MWHLYQRRLKTSLSFMVNTLIQHDNGSYPPPHVLCKFNYRLKKFIFIVITTLELRCTDLVWAHAAGVEVGVASGRIDGVLFKVLADVLRGGLRQQAVDTLPAETNRADNKHIQ